MMHLLLSLLGYESIDIFAQAFIRACGFAFFLPLGEGSAGIRRKTGLALLLALVAGGQKLEFDWNLLLPSFLMGLLAGLPVFLLVEIARMTGELFDVGRGQNLGSMYDPLSGTSGAAMGKAFKWAVWVAILQQGALTFATGAYLRSGSVSEAFLSSPYTECGSLLLSYLNISLTNVLLFYLPLAIIFLISDSAIALIAKLIPGFQCFAESFTLKTLVGFMVLIYLLQFDVWSIFRGVVPSVEMEAGGGDWDSVVFKKGAGPGLGPGAGAGRGVTVVGGKTGVFREGRQG